MQDTSYSRSSERALPQTRHLDPLYLPFITLYSKIYWLRPKHLERWYTEVLHHEWLRRRIAAALRKFHLGADSFDEARQEFALVLVRKLPHFPPRERLAALPTFVRRTLYGIARKIARHHFRHSNPLWLASTTGTAACVDLLAEEVPVPDQVDKRVLLRRLDANAQRWLSQIEYAVICYRYRNYLTLRATAERMSLPFWNVRTIEQRALRKLRARLIEED